MYVPKRAGQENTKRGAQPMMKHLPKFLLFSDSLLGWLYRRDVGVIRLNENGDSVREVLK